MTDIIIYTLVLILFFGGITLSLVNLPGIWLVFIGLLIFGISTGFSIITVGTFVFLFIFSLIIGFIDNFIILLGAKKYGASKAGILGSLLGGFLGLSAPPVGLIVGPFLGATLFELLFAKKDMDKALKAGTGALIGFLLSVVVKFGGVVAMVIWGLFKIF